MNTLDTMERTAVRSRDIAVIGYDPSSFTLEVTFRSGGVYHYSGVPEEIYREFLSVSSQGRYFEQNIKHLFLYRKVR